MNLANLKIGGKYNWKGQKERLVYLGYNWSGNGYWYQFALVEKPTDVWCEVQIGDLGSFEETLEKPVDTVNEAVQDTTDIPATNVWKEQIRQLETHTAVNQDSKGFSPSELTLPYGKWVELSKSRYPHASQSVRDWVRHWEFADSVLSPIDDNERRFVRYGHYLGYAIGEDSAKRSIPAVKIVSKLTPLTKDEIRTVLLKAEFPAYSLSKISEHTLFEIAEVITRGVEKAHDVRLRST